MNSVRHLVSKKKRRYKKDGFDLDLSYITKNIIAMGFPSEGTEGLYRNKMSETQRFLETKHKDHYKVYNLCSEDNRVYDHAKFHDRVAKFPFPDHNAPPFSLMEPCCADAAAYLGEDESNVIALHCKAGKGRTGVMTCALLMHMGAFKDAQEALDFYGKARTKNGKGVTIPSQTRFVKYYGKFMQSKVPYTPTPIVLKSIRLIGIPNIDRGTCIPLFTVRQGPSVGPSTELHTSAPYPGIAAGAADAVLELSAPCTLAGDIKSLLISTLRSILPAVSCWLLDGGGCRWVMVMCRTIETPIFLPNDIVLLFRSAIIPTLSSFITLVYITRGGDRGGWDVMAYGLPP